MLRSSEAKESRACPGRDGGHRRRQASPTPSTARVVEAQEPSERRVRPRLADQNHGMHRLVDMLLKIEGMRIAVVDFVVVWGMGSLMSTSKEAHLARGELLAAQKGLVGRQRFGSDEISVVGLEACGEHCCQLSKVDLSICKKLNDYAL